MLAANRPRFFTDGLDQHRRRKVQPNHVGGAGGAKRESEVACACCHVQDADLRRLATAKRFSHCEASPGDVSATSHQAVHEVVSWDDAIEHCAHVIAGPDRALGGRVLIPPHKTSPTANATENHKQSRAVSPSTGFNLRPSTSQTCRTRWNANGAVVHASSGHGLDSPD